MANNPHRLGSSAAQSFTRDELLALDDVLAKIRLGAHPRDLQRLLRSNAGRSVQRKVAAMRDSIERQKALGLHLAAGGKP